MVEEYEYENNIEEEYAEDQAEEDYEDQSDLQQDMMDDLAPQSQKKDDLYSLFWKVIKIQDSSKVGNLSKEELGMFSISVRDLQKIHLLAISLGHKYFADFFALQSEIILKTSSSRDGWLPELFVSNKMTKTKSKKYNAANLLNQPQQKKSLFKWRGK